MQPRGLRLNWYSLEQQEACYLEVLSFADNLQVCIMAWGGTGLRSCLALYLMQRGGASPASMILQPCYQIFTPS